LAVAHILRVNYAKTAEDRFGQPAYESFSIKTFTFSSQIFGLLHSRSLPYGDFKFEHSFKTHYCTRLSGWQDHYYRASRELA